MNIRAGVISGVVGQVAAITGMLWATPRTLAALGPLGFGAFALLSALIGYASILDLGLSAAATQELALARPKGTTIVREVLSNSVSVIWIQGAIVALGIGAITPWILSGGRNLASIAFFCAAGGFFFIAKVPFEACLIAHEKLPLVNYVAAASNLMKTVGVAIAVTFAPSLFAASAMLATASGLQLCALVLVSTFTCAGWRFTSPMALASKNLFRRGLSIWVFTLASSAAYELPKPMLSSIRGVVSVGPYSVALELATKIWLLPNLIGRTLLAPLAATFEFGSDRTPSPRGNDRQTLAIRYLLTSLIGSSPLIALAVAMPRDAIFVWLGNGPVAETALSMLPPLAIGIAANVAAQVSIVCLQLAGDLRFLAKLQILLTSSHLALALPAIYLFGPKGVCMSWALSQIVLVVATTHRTVRVCEVRLYWALLKGSAVIGISVAAVFCATALAPNAKEGAVSIGLRLLENLTRLAMVCTASAGVCIAIATRRLFAKKRPGRPSWGSP